MKKLILSTIFYFALTTFLHAQTKKVNEDCGSVPCESGLYCVEIKNGQHKCATCDQSTLNSLTSDVENACKSFGSGWTPESSQDYQDVLAPDGRVLVDVFDKMLDNAKKCKEAREYREDKCWNKGDQEHQDAIKQVKESIDRMSTHKYKMISDRRVYYGSKNTYLSRLSTFKSKSDLNFPDIDQKLSIIERDINDGKKVSCSDIEKFSNDCERCVDASKDLYSDGFGNSSDKFPDEYNTIFTKAQDLMKRAKAALDNAKSKSLCN